MAGSAILSGMTYQERHQPHGDLQTRSGSGKTGRDAFEAELIREVPHLQNYALSLTRDPARAGDLVQDCVVRALESWGGYRPGTHMRRWLFTILRNRYLDVCRREVRRGKPISLEDCRPSSGLAQPASQEDWIEVRELLRRLRGIRTCDRNVLLLCVFSQLSQSEIAKRLGIAEGTVRSRLSRARALLRSEEGCEGVRA